jgi:hypothetical protein
VDATYRRQRCAMPARSARKVMKKTEAVYASLKALESKMRPAESTRLTCI